ncbi:MAG: beta-galactosidase trimerization domain-containing protein [Candidatus Firestonebacteria bacterium]
MYRKSCFENGIVMNGNHEPLIFRRRAGYAKINEEKIFKEEHSIETIKKLKEFGITVVRTHYYKGYGLKVENEEIEMTKEFIKKCHKYGIKVQGYLQLGTFQYETMFAEEPSSRNWARINQWGEKVGITYGHQLFRYLPCLNQENYIRYLEKVIRKGIVELKLDMIAFDNVGLGPEPELCHCEECEKKFKEFVFKKYKLNTAEGRKLAKERFGFSELNFIEIPSWKRWNMPITCYEVKDPLMQEWLDFKCETLRIVFERIYKFTNNLNPDIILDYNAYGWWGHNSIFWDSVDLYRLGKYTDCFYNEHDPHAEITADGRILSSIRSYKLARAMGNVVIPNIGDKTEKHLKLSMAENLVFNQGHIGNFGYIMDVDRYPVRKEYVRFRTKNKEMFWNKSSLANVAVLESYASMAFNRVRTYYSNVAIIQTLLMGKVPFDIVLDKDLGDLSKYSLLILPDVECLSNDQIENIKRFIKSGGNILFTEKSGEFDEWYRKREKNPLLTLKSGSKTGKLAFIKEIKHKIPYSYKVEDWYIDAKYWHLPLNYKEILRTVFSLLGGERLVEMKINNYCMIELLGDREKTYLHLVNFDVEKTLKKIKIRVKTDKNISSVKALSPEDSNAGEVKYRKVKNTVEFTIEKVGTYKLCVIE